MTKFTKPAPFLRWAGGKSKMLKHIREHVPDDFNNYFEPFLGGGAVFFDIFKKCKTAFLSDINNDLINAYRVVRDSTDELMEQLLSDFERHSKGFYYLTRNIDRHLKDPISRAVRFIYLNQTCYNGLYRENNNGEFNVPMGDKTPNLQKLAFRIYSCSEALKDTIIVKCAFEKTKPKKDDFVYLDPPYFKDSKGYFTEYNKGGFASEDHLRLKDYVDKLDKKGVKFLMSNSDTPTTRKLFKDYTISRMHNTKNINPKSKNRKTTELLIKNY